MTDKGVHMTDKTLAQRVAVRLRETLVLTDVRGTYMDCNADMALAEFVLAADAAITELEALPGSYDAALAALAKALGVEK